METLEFQQKLFAAGRQFGYEDMEIYYERAVQFGCKLFNGDIDSYESSEVSGISFRGLVEGQMGYAFTEKIDEESIAFLLKSAKDNALLIDDEDYDEIFAGSPRYENQDFFAPALSRVTTAQKIEFLKDVERQALRFDKRITGLDYCMLGSSEGERVLANSKGLSLSDKQNSLFLFISVIAKEGDEVKTGSCIKLTKDFAQLCAADIARQACDEALSQLGAQSIPSKAYPIVLRNDIAATLIATYAGIFSAEQAQKGRSLLKDKEGEVIAFEGFTLVDDPFLATGFSSRNFDGEGSASRTLRVVEHGRLNSLLHSRKTAKKAGVESTGHAYKPSYKGAISVAPSNLYVEPTTTSFDEIVGDIGEGILITDLAGLHSGANPISGDFSLAAKGFYIKEGKLNGAVNQMTIAGNFFDLLNSIEAVGSDLEFTTPFGNGYVGSPSLAVRQLTVTVD